MPRELVHWCVVDEVIELLDESREPNLRACLQRNRDLVYLGAVAHDAPYFYKRGHHPFETLSEYLHGFNGEDTLEPLKEVLREIQLHQSQEVREKLVSFMVGMICHLGTDIVFHPMIYYFTGNYNDRDLVLRKSARARHRLFETYLDSWFAHEVGLDASLPRTVGELLKRSAPDLESIYDVLAGGLATAEKRADHKMYWGESFKEMALLQRLFVTDVVGALVRVGAILTGDKLRGIDALFSFRRRSAEQIFNDSLKYRNPLTGEPENKQVIQLYQQAITECIELLDDFESLIGPNPAALPQSFLSAKGRSLNLGIFGGKVSDTTFYSASGFNLPGLQK